MSVRPLLGASYHTIHTSPLFDIDLEAEASPHFNHFPQKNIYTSKERLPLLDQIPSSRTVRHRAPPVMLVLLLLCCLAFVVCAYTGRPSNHLIMSDMSASHAHGWLSSHISAAFRSQSYRSSVKENIEGALEILYAYTHRCAYDFLILGNREKHNLDGSGVEGHQAELREYLRQTFPLAYVTSLIPLPIRLVRKLMHRYIGTLLSNGLMSVNRRSSCTGKALTAA